VWIPHFPLFCLKTLSSVLTFDLQGETNRVIAEHALNRNSSRSHCIFTIYIEVRAPAVFLGTQMAEDLYVSVFSCISVLSTL